MKTIGAGKFKARCLALLDEVASSREVIVVTKRGKPVAQVSPAVGKEGNARRRLKGSVLREGDIVSPVGEVWEAAS